MRACIMVVMLAGAGCLPRPEPAAPVQPVAPATYAPPAYPAPLDGTAPVAQAYPQPQPSPPPGQPYPPPQAYPPPSQPYPPPPYAAPVAYPAPPTPHPIASASEVSFDFGTVGTLAAITVLARQDINSSADTFIVLAGLAGGAAGGYILADRYPGTGGVSHSTTLGLLLGITDGALLIQPTGADHADSVLGLLTAGAAVGTVGGFLYGHTADLTTGQSWFVANLTLLGSSTGALAAISAAGNGGFGGWQDAALAIGVNGGAVVGAVVAPSLSWSPRRAKTVAAATFVGAAVGGLIAGLAATPRNGSTSETSGDVVTASLTAGMWGGFGLGILLTHDWAPDAQFAQPVQRGTSAQSQSSVAPWIGANGQFGVMAGGAF